MSSSTSSSAAVPSILRRKRTLLSTLTALTFVLVVLPATAFADTTWTGTTDQDWATPTNWTAGVPDNADTAIINNTSANDPIVSTAGQIAGAVQLSGDKQLNITAGDLDVAGQITAPAGTNVNLTGGGLEFGTILVDNASGFTMAGGSLTGTLTASTPVTLVNSSTDYAQAAGETVTLGTNVNVNQTGDITMGPLATLNIGTHLYTLSGSSIGVTGGIAEPSTINISAGGRLLHTGALGGVVNPQINSSGTLEDDGGTAALSITPGFPFNANQLGGTLKTTGAGFINMGSAGGDTYTVKAGGLSIDNPNGAVQWAGDAGDPFNLNGQTISLLNGNFTHAASGDIAGTGTINRVAPNGGEFLINAGEYANGANVTITQGTTARVIGDSSWDNTFNFNINGTLLLDGTIVTAPDTGTTPQVNISSTGLLTHTGANTGLFEPRVVSNGGTIQDASSGELRLERSAVVAQTNLYSGTIRTASGGGAPDVDLGTQVHRLQGPLTMDSSQGGEIRTINNADLQLNNQTLTLIGPSALEHESGTISGTGTINGPGILRVEGGDFAGGGTMNVNAQTIQPSATNVGGFGSELRIGGDWLSNANITFSESATVRVVSGGVLRHNSGTSEVSAPLTIDSGATVNADAGQLQLSDLSNYSGTTLSGGAYNIANSSSLCIDGALETLDAELSINGSGALLYAPPGCATNAITNELATITPAGTFTLVNDHVANIDTPLTVAGGLLTGNGTIIGSVINNGDVSPGLSIGQLNIDGDYTQGAVGDLNIEAQGKGAGQFDVLEVDGNVNLDGDLEMIPIGGYPAAAKGGDRIPFLRYTGVRNGEFANVNTDPPLAIGQPFFAEYDDAGKRVIAVLGNTFKFGRVVNRNRERGTATLIVKVTGAGLLELFGNQVKDAAKSAPGAGKEKFRIKATGAKRADLNDDGKTKVKAKVRYTPEIGNPSVKTKKITLFKNV